MISVIDEYISFIKHFLNLLIQLLYSHIHLFDAAAVGPPFDQQDSFATP